MIEDKIEQAKQAVILERYLVWRKKWMDDNQEPGETDGHIFARVPKPPEDLYPKDWVVYSWWTGCLVMDAEVYNNLPAVKRRKFERLTRIF